MFFFYMGNIQKSSNLLELALINEQTQDLGREMKLEAGLCIARFKVVTRWKP